MNVLKRNTPSIALCLFELLVGVLRLINPIGFTTGILIAAGAVLIILGIIGIVQYFRMTPVQAAVRQTLTRGLISLLAGGFLFFNHSWFIATFPILTILYGVIILVIGLSKIQLSLDMFRSKKGKWFLPAISAAVSIICAVVILRNPFTSTAVLWTFTGLSMIIDSIFDIVVLVFKARSEGEAAA